LILDGSELQAAVPSVRARERLTGPVRQPQSNRNGGSNKFDFDRMGSVAEVDKRLEEMAVGGTGIKVTSKSGQVAVGDGSLAKQFVSAIINGYNNDKPARRVVLWCTFCNTYINANKIKCGEHCLSDKHKDARKKKRHTVAMKLSMGEFLKQYRSTTGKLAHGSTVCDRTDARRFEVVWHFLMAGVPLEKLASASVEDPDDENLGRIVRGKDGAGDICESSHIQSFFRGLLEAGGQPALTDPSHLRKDYVPLIRKFEKARIRTALGFDVDAEDSSSSEVTWITLIQDTTPRIDNHWGVVARFVTQELKVYEVALELSKWESLSTHVHLVNVIQALIRKLHIPHGSIILWMGDRCAVNGAAVKRLRPVYGGMAGHCSSHTLDLTAEKFYTSELLDFSHLLTAMMTAQGGVNKARRHWRNVFGTEFKEPNKIRWWSTEEMWFAWFNVITFPRLVQFLRSLPQDEEDGGGDADESGARLRKVTALLDDPARMLELEFELGVNYYTMRAMVEATYTLEGTRPSLPLIHADVLSRVRTFYNSNFVNLSFPGLTEFTDKASDDYVKAQPAWIAARLYPAASLHNVVRSLDQAKLNLKEKVRSMLSDVVDTLNSKFFVDNARGVPAPCIDDVRRAVIFRLVNPLYARELDLNVLPHLDQELQWLNNDGGQTWFTQDDMEAIDVEYPLFVQEAKGLEVRLDDMKPEPAMDRIEDFWTFRRQRFPSLSKLVRFAYTCTASSASVERLFSLLKRTFSLQQMKFALEDYVEASVMLQFNRKFITHFA
jgi:hypothetical protein